MISAAVAALGLGLPAVASAQPPSNDDFGASTAVTALPYAVRLDTSQATKASDDPFWCQGFDIGGTVWFDYTATDNGLLRATTAGSNYGTILSANTGERGQLVGVPGACGTGFSSGASITFRATAGTTYHFMVAGFDVPGGTLSFGLQVVAPAPNDDFADAEPVSTLPAIRDLNLSVAFGEPEEPAARCGGSSSHTVWYAFTPAQRVSVRAGVGQFDNAVAVYTGSELSNLQALDCAHGGFDTALFGANAGQTYYIQVSGPALNNGGADTLTLTEAPPLRPFFDTSPSDPTIFEETNFHADSGDFDAPIASGQFDFGDGTTAPVGEFDNAAHHYTVDGTYQVRLDVTSADGRTATVTSPVTVDTHDVSISKFSVPTKARTGDTKTIVVQVANTRYRESGVTTDLYASDGSSWKLVGTLTLDVPARVDRTVKFPFAYTFSAADAVVGKVTFRAVVRMPFGVRDARPMDNEVIALSTTVQPSLADLRFA